MAYQGGGGGPPTLHNGYWPGHDPPNANTYSNPTQGRHPRVSSTPNGTQSQYQPPTPTSTYVGQGQYWNQNVQPQYAQGTTVPYPAVNGNRVQSPSHVPPPAPTRPQRPQTQSHQAQPQFVSPAQLFQQPAQAQPLSQYMSPQQIFQPLRTTASSTSARVAPVQKASFEIDIPNLLMSLAEEYFDAAHELAPLIAASMTLEDVNTYQKLIATGLSCLETALKNVKLPPRMEANIRLRYAGVLYEETEDSIEAETSLSKGIALCDRNHYYDIKYAMQFLVAQFLFKKNPKAAMKALDSQISEAIVYQHFSWVYALRFLRSSYSLESDNPTDTHAAIQNLRNIANLSSQQNDVAIFIAASLLEAMAHLKSSGSESLEQAQRAIAAARTHQLDTAAQLPQLTGLAHILDVVCSIKQGNPIIMMDRLKSMQIMMDGAVKDPTWSSTDDAVAIPISPTKNNSSQVVSRDTRMIIGIGGDGRDNLMMSFLSKKDAFSITYLLCGMVLMHRNSIDQKATKFLEQGLTSLQENIRSSRSSAGLLPNCVFKNQWRGQILCYFHSYMAFCVAVVGDWAGMDAHLKNLRAASKTHDVSLVGPLDSLAIYLGGMYHQGVGDLDAALRIFRDPKFDLSHFKGTNLSSASQFLRDVSLLAALNTLQILQHADRQDHNVNTALIAKIEDICEHHPNRDIQTAFNLVLATLNVNPPAPLFKTKAYLAAALSGAQATTNTQLLCITLNVMCSRFFANVIGDQAEKSAKAASIQAKKNGNILWRSVAEGMLAQYYDVNGKKEEAAKTYEQAQRMAKIAMPES